MSDPYGDPRVRNWNDRLNAVHDELAALKREHKRLREAAERAATVLKGVNTSARNQCLAALRGLSEEEYPDALDATPDATPAEQTEPVSSRGNHAEFLENCLRAQAEYSGRLFKAAELVLGDWANVKTRDALRAALDACLPPHPLPWRYDQEKVQELLGALDTFEVTDVACGGVRVRGLIAVRSAAAAVRDSEKKP